MIKIPYNKIKEDKGITYYMELKHHIKMAQVYRIYTDRTETNKRYNIKYYNKVSGK